MSSIDSVDAFPPTLRDRDRSRLGQLSQLLDRYRAGLSYVDYKQAERDCECLAERLLAIYSRQDLQGFGFIGMPRGGLIVLGMLSYPLGLKSEQLQPTAAHSGPIGFVDDCALTGARFAGQLARVRNPDVVFAHLYSHPALRRSILEREPRVQHCLAAKDLHDDSHRRLDGPEAYSVWRTRWSERLGLERYWTGMTDPICFPWTEPDQVFWNPTSERVEDGWRFLSPHLCLKNKAGLGLPPRFVEAPVWQVPAAVVFGQFDGSLWLVQTDTGQVYGLDGVSADMWRALAGYGDPVVAADYLTDQYAVGESELLRDLTSFAEDLQTKGLLDKIA